MSMDLSDSFDRFDPEGPPPRPTTPPVRRGFLVLLAALSLAVILVYGVPFIAERTGYAWEAGRSRAATEALKNLDGQGAIDHASSLFRLAVTKVSPAVVNIRTWRAPDAKARPKPGVESPLGPMLVPFGSGSGVIIDKVKGYIVTNHHVIKDADEVIVRLGRHAEYPAKIVGADPKTDLAVLQIQAPLRVEAHWADSKTTDVGDWVLAIGSPYLLDQTVTAGIVSATRRNNLPSLNQDQYQDFIQTDAAVNPGNSGGPLINLQGEIVGINTAIFAPRAGQEEAGNVGIGLAISATMAKQVTDQLIKHGRVSRGYLGLAFEEVQAD
ncbi:MAG: trypsin-like peptidase domain-containing protein, partial [Isosphaeraceae bacterium]